MTPIVPRALPKTFEERRMAIADVLGGLGLDENEVLGALEKRDWNLSDQFLLKPDLDHDELVSLSASELAWFGNRSVIPARSNAAFQISHVVGYTGLTNKSDMKKDSN